MTDPAHNTPAGMMARLRQRERRLVETQMGVRVGAGVGGVFTYISDAEVNALAGTEDNAFRALQTDMYAQLVYDDPDAVRADAQVYRDLAASAPTEDVRKAQQTIADVLAAEADRLDARAATLPTETVKAHRAWASGYRNFMARWRPYYDAHFPDEKDVIGSLASTYWTEITAYDHEYRDFFVSFPGPGKPSRPMPESPESKLKALRETGGTSGISIPWTKIFIGAAIVAGGYWILTKRRAEATTVAVLPEVKVGRPEVGP